MGNYSMLKICGILLYLHVGPKMDPYTYEHTHCIYGFGQPRLTLLTNYMKVTHDNYNTTWINETFVKNFFVTTLQLLYWIFMQLPNY